MTDHQLPQYGRPGRPPWAASPAAPPNPVSGPATYGDAAIYRTADGPVGGSWGQLAIHAKAGAAFAITSPKVYVNGSPAPVRHGTNLFTVLPGWNVVTARSTGLYFIPLSAQAAVYVPPNGTGEIFYATPVHWACSPRLGPVPQKRAGTILLVAVLVFIVACLTVGVPLTMMAAFPN